MPLVQKRVLRDFIAFGVLLPMVLGALSFVVLKKQPVRTWRSLMPTVNFKKPALNLKVIVVSHTDKRNWEDLYQSHYFYPKGAWLWLVPKENLKPGARSGPGGNGLAYAVDQKGRFFKYRSTKNVDEGIEFTLVERPIEFVDIVSNGLVVTEDQQAFKKMQARVAQLNKMPTVLKFEEAWGKEESPDVSAELGTVLKPHSILRFAVLWAMFIACGILISRYLSNSHQYLAWALSLPLSLISLLGLLMVGGNVFADRMTLWPLILFGVFSGAWIFLSLQSKKSVLGDAQESLSQLKILSKSRTVWVVSTALILGVGYWLSFFPSYGLTMGDACALMYKAIFVYDYGSYPLVEISKYFGAQSLNASYPPGSSATIGYAMWAVGPEKTKIFFPGQETGSIVLIYAFLSAGLHLSLVAMTVALMRQTFPKQMGTAIIAGLFVLYVMPTTQGFPHAAEEIMWPMFAMALVSTLLWMRTHAGFWAVMAGIFSASLPYFKAESVYQWMILILPWVIMAAIKTKVYGRSWRGYAIAFAITLLPWLLWKIQIHQLGISSFDYLPVTVSKLFGSWESYRQLLEQTWKITMAWGDVHYVKHSAWLVFLTIGVCGVSQILRPNLWLTLPILGLVIYLVAFPSLYLFSTWNPVSLHVFQSWGRVVVPSYLCMGALLYEIAYQHSLKKS